MINKDIFNEIFESYNLKIQKACEEGLMTVKSPKEYEDLINIARNEWEKEKINENLPSFYFSQISDLEELKDVFMKANEICDEFIPISFVNTIKNINGIDLIKDYVVLESELEIKATAIKILGELGNKEFVNLLIEEIYKTDEDLIKEVARQAIIDIGRDSLDELTKKLENVDYLEEDDFHLLIAIVEIDKSKRNNKVYQTLKEFFRKSKDKGIAARCLADYNDPRAIVLLRGFITRNKEDLTNDEQLEIKGAIMALGGQVNDL